MALKTKKPAVIKNDWLKTYDEEWPHGPQGHFSRSREYQWALGLIRKKDTIVDAGCGINGMSHVLSCEGRVCVGIDINQAAVDATYGMDGNGKGTGICTDVSLHVRQIEPGTIDRIIAIDLLGCQVVEDSRSKLAVIKDTLHEFSRMLNEKGVILLTVHMHEFKPESLTLPQLRVLVDDSALRFLDSVHWDTEDVCYDPGYGTSVYHCALVKR